MSMTYSDYLKVDDILSLQVPQSEPAEHDELLFITIHQVYELWFNQILHELDRLPSLFAAQDLGRSIHTLKRVRTIFKTLVAQVDILETMTPLEFNSFRDRLGTSSGFQSFQFRELEFLLGKKSTAPLKNYDDAPQHKERLAKRLAAPSLWDEFLNLLDSLGHKVEKSTTREATQPSEINQQALIKIYNEDSQLASVCEMLVDLDEGLQEWRYRHVKMVERTIGVKMGSGGSAGAKYLMNTLFNPVFPDLWEIRNQF